MTFKLSQWGHLERLILGRGGHSGAQRKIPVVLHFLDYRHKACCESPLAKLALLALSSWLAIASCGALNYAKIFASLKM